MHKDYNGMSWFKCKILSIRDSKKQKNPLYKFAIVTVEFYNTGSQNELEFFCNGGILDKFKNTLQVGDSAILECWIGQRKNGLHCPCGKLTEELKKIDCQCGVLEKIPSFTILKFEKVYAHEDVSIGDLILEQPRPISNEYPERLLFKPRERSLAALYPLMGKPLLNFHAPDDRRLYFKLRKRLAFHLTHDKDLSCNDVANIMKINVTSVSKYSIEYKDKYYAKDRYSARTKS